MKKYKNIIIGLVVVILLLFNVIVDQQYKIDKLKHQIQIEQSEYFNRNLYI